MPGPPSTSDGGGCVGYHPQSCVGRPASRRRRLRRAAAQLASGTAGWLQRPAKRNGAAKLACGHPPDRPAPPGAWSCAAGGARPRLLHARRLGVAAPRPLTPMPQAACLHRQFGGGALLPTSAVLCVCGALRPSFAMLQQRDVAPSLAPRQATRTPSGSLLPLACLIVG